MNRSHNRARRFSAVLIGLCFVNSGLFKLLDLAGTALIMEEYFRFFHLNFLLPVAAPSGFILALIETLLGVSLVCGVWRKPVIHIATGFVIFFTIITLILWIKNPPMDCGCFGEVIHLTHGQTLVKNLILLALSLFSLFPRMDYWVPKKRKYFTFCIGSFIVICFAIYGIWNIPLVDLTPFQPNVRLMQAVADEEGDSPSISMFQSVFVYEKDGKQECFSIDEIPDSTWTFVETKAVEDMEYVESPDLPLTSLEGETCSDRACQGLVMAQSVYDADSYGRKDWMDTKTFVEDCMALGYSPLVLVASGPQELRQKLVSLGIYEELKDYVFSSDYRTVLSLNRSNGGVTLFDDGLLIAKWSVYFYPDRKEMTQLSEYEPLDILSTYETEGRIAFQLIYILLIIIILL